MTHLKLLASIMLFVALAASSTTTHGALDWIFSFTGFCFAAAIVWVFFVNRVRRLHDLGKSGWWLFFELVPVVGSIWTLIELGFFPGKAGTNAYGPETLKRPLIGPIVKPRQAKVALVPSNASALPPRTTPVTAEDRRFAAAQAYNNRRKDQ